MRQEVQRDQSFRTYLWEMKRTCGELDALGMSRSFAEKRPGEVMVQRRL